MREELRKSLSWEVSLHQEHLNKRVEAGGRAGGGSQRIGSSDKGVVNSINS